MNFGKTLFGCALVAALTACSSLQVQRDLDHAANTDAYQASLANATAFSSSVCRQAEPMKSWIAFEFSKTTPIYTLPAGTKASALCFAIPAGAKILQLHTTARGGTTYHQLTMIHPSLLFIQEDGSVVKNVEAPRLSPGEGLWGGFGLSGNVVLGADLREAVKVIVYVHPMSLDGAVDVQTGFESIPVPYGPYGVGKLRFQ